MQSSSLPKSLKQLSNETCNSLFFCCVFCQTANDQQHIHFVLLNVEIGTNPHFETRRQTFLLSC